MAASDVPNRPLDVRFESSIDLTVHDARLSVGGLLQCDPVGYVDLVSVRRRIVDNKASVCFSARRLGQTTKKIFTSTPVFDDTLHFTVSDTSCLTTLSSKLLESTEKEGVEDSVVITFEDATSHKFLGQAYCPFSPHSPSTVPASTPVRVMLQPRNVLDSSDLLFLEDVASLRTEGLDDFGSVGISWKVVVMPMGGAVDTAGGEEQPAAAEQPAGGSTAPIGITVKATWLLPESRGRDSCVQYATSMEFGDGKRFRLPDDKPLFLTLRSAADLRASIFCCSAHNHVKPDKSRDIPVVIPLPSTRSPKGLDRDIRWAAAVRSGLGEDFGILVATMRLSKRPLEGNTPQCPASGACLKINDPLHQEEYSHIAMDYQREPPNAPYGAYQPLCWESEDHIRLSLERRRRRDVVRTADPSAEHVRHVFDVLLGRATLDEGVALLASNFFQCPAADLVALQLKELMVALAFNSRKLSVVDAARFLFIAFRSDVEDAVAIEEVHYMIKHALLEKTLDMPEQELRRWVTDVFGTEVKVVRYTDFAAFLLQNYAFWYLLGAPLKMDRASSCEPLPHVAQPQLQDSGVLRPTACYRDANTAPEGLAAKSSGSAVQSRKGTPTPAGKNVQFQTASGSSTQATWRTFVVRVEGGSQQAFSVTVHSSDKVRDAMKMVEDSVRIKAECQQWKLNNEILLEPGTVIGNTVLGVEPALKGEKNAATLPEVWISEMEEAVLITFVYKDKGKKWQQRIPTKEKVLQIRAAVQRHTLIPLSRCVLRLMRSGKGIVLQDRHMFAHYTPQSNEVVEVTQE